MVIHTLATRTTADLVSRTTACLVGLERSQESEEQFAGGAGGAGVFAATVNAQGLANWADNACWAVIITSSAGGVVADDLAGVALRHGSTMELTVCTLSVGADDLACDGAGDTGRT